MTEFSDQIVIILLTVIGVMFFGAIAWEIGRALKKRKG